MDKKIQKKILKILILKKEPLDLGGIHSNLGNFNKPVLNDVKNQINFLMDDDAIKIALELSYDHGRYTTYRITEWGILKERGGIKKWWHWLINKNHNFISFIAVAISIIALLYSIYHN